MNIDQAASQDEAQTNQSSEDNQDTIQLAREMGWKPESEWKGEPPKGGFTSASDFIKRGEKILPIVNARARKAEEEAKTLRDEMAQMRNDHRETVKRIEKMTTVALDQQRSRIEAEYAAKKEAAVEVGDKAAYREIVKEEREVNKAMDDRLKEAEPDPKTKAAEGAKLPKALQETIDDWLAENDWFNKDEELHGMANLHYNKLTRDKPGMDERQKLNAVRAYVAKRFPEKFGGEPDEEEDEKPRGSRVEGGSRLNGGGSRGTGYAKLPAEAKEAADRFIKDQGLFLNAGETVEKNLSQARERYAAQYFEDMK